MECETNNDIIRAPNVCFPDEGFDTFLITDDVSDEDNDGTTTARRCRVSNGDEGCTPKRKLPSRKCNKNKTKQTHRFLSSPKTRRHCYNDHQHFLSYFDDGDVLHPRQTRSSKRLLSNGVAADHQHHGHHRRRQCSQDASGGDKCKNTCCRHRKWKSKLTTDVSKLQMVITRLPGTDSED